MSAFIPKNARKILSNPALQTEYFLKPYGLDVSVVILRFLKIKIILKSIPNINSSSIKLSSSDQAKK